MYQPLFARLTPEAKQKLLKGNYERVFDEARRKSGRGKPRTRSDADRNERSEQ